MTPAAELAALGTGLMAGCAIVAVTLFGMERWGWRALAVAVAIIVLAVPVLWCVL